MDGLVTAGGLNLLHYLFLALAGALMVSMSFSSGSLTLINTLGKNSSEQLIIRQVIGKIWIMFPSGVLLFMLVSLFSFPVFFAAGIMGAWWLWAALILVLALQVMAWLFRPEPERVTECRVSCITLCISGAAGLILMGSFFGSFFTGADFYLDRTSNDQQGYLPSTVYWMGEANGLETLLQWRNLVPGLALFFLARTAGVLYIMSKTGEARILQRARRQLLINDIPFLLLFLFFLYVTLIRPGYQIEVVSDLIEYRSRKYFRNLLQMPWLLMVFSGGFVSVILGFLLSYLGNENNLRKGFSYALAGVFIITLSLFFLAGLNHTPFFPSRIDLDSSLGYHNASSGTTVQIIAGGMYLLLAGVSIYLAFRKKQDLPGN